MNSFTYVMKITKAEYLGNSFKMCTSEICTTEMRRNQEPGIKDHVFIYEYVHLLGLLCCHGGNPGVRNGRRSQSKAHVALV